MHELIHTSLPRGLFGGSGYAVAAATRDMPETLRNQLQGMSNLEDSCLTWRSSIVQAAGGAWLVISRLQPAPADHTGRSNSIAHHVALSFETDGRADPAAVLRNHPWRATWSGEPRWLEKAVPPAPLPQTASASAWQGLGLDPGWAGKLAEDRGRPVAVVYPSTVVDPLPLVLDALCLLPVADRWQVSFHTQPRAFTRAPGWWWVRTDKTQAREFRLQPGALDLTRGDKAPGAEPLVLRARGRVVSTPPRQAVGQPATPANEPAAPFLGYEELPARRRGTGRGWLALVGAGLAGLLLGVLPLGWFAWRLDSQVNDAQRDKAEQEQQKAGMILENKRELEKTFQVELKKANDAANVARQDAESAFEKARVHTALLDWNGDEVDLREALKDKATKKTIDEVAQSKMVKGRMKLPAAPHVVVSISELLKMPAGRVIELDAKVAKDLHAASDDKEKPALIQEGLTNPKAGPRLVLLGPRDLAAVRETLDKADKVLSVNDLDGLKNNETRETVRLSLTPAEWKIWLGKEHAGLQDDQKRKLFSGVLTWKSLVNKTLPPDTDLVTVGAVRTFFLEIHGIPVWGKAAKEPNEPIINLCRKLELALRDPETRQMIDLNDKDAFDNVQKALIQMNDKWDAEWDTFAGKKGPQATQPVRDALLKLKGNLELLGASISHGKNIPVEAKDAMMKLKNSLNDRVRKLVEKDLFGWLPGEVKPREVPGGKP